MADIPLPSIRRSPEEIQRVRDYMTMLRGAERGSFYCLKCGANLTSICVTLPNDGLTHVRPCPNSKCGILMPFNAGVLAAKLLEAGALKSQGLGPRVEPGKGDGQLEEKALPDGRKLIIARPGAAELRAFSGPGRKA